MSKIKYNDYNFGESLMNRIKVNKRPNINNNIKNITSKDSLYYSMEKKAKMQKNKIPSLLTKNNRKKLNEIIKENNNNIVKYVNRDTFKKTINTYSNEARSKEGNIFEELQNNKYLRPMLGTTNINTKLLKCQIENPIKNIDTLSLKKYFANNIEFPFQKYQSPQKYNYNNDEISADDKTNLYNLNNRTAIERFNINLNNGYSPTNDMLYVGENNSNSLAYSGDSYLLNNYLVKYSSNNIKKYAKNQVGRMRKEKYFYSEERKEKDDSNSNKGSAKAKIYYKNKNTIRMGSPSNNNSVKNKTKYANIYGCLGTKINLQKKIKKDKALLEYKCKLVEKFLFILNKFITKNLDKNKSFFINQLINYNKKSKSQTKNKIYFKKKNHRFDKKITLIKKHSEDINKNYIFNFDKEKEKEKDKFKAKVTTDTSTNFNMGNKSFSNEKKNSSLSNNYILNNIKINNQSSSFLFSEQKHKNYSQSPNNSLSNKHPKSQIKTKTIIYKKQLSGSPHRITGKSQSQNETRESGGAGVDTFIYKKKNLNSENMYINKIQNFELKSLYSQSKKYNKIINNNKKGKIIGIDINLGKPVNIINDHSPLDELLLEKNNSLLYKLHTISSKFMNKNKNKKKNKEKSGSKKKIKPPLRTKRFLEEDDDEFIQNFYMDSNSNSNSNSNRAYSSIKRYSKEHNVMNKYLYNSLEEINSKINGDRNFIKKNKERKDNKDNKETIIKGDKLTIRIKYITFFNNKKKNTLCNNNFKYLIIDKRKSISFSINKKIKKRKTNEIINKKGKNHKKKVSKLYVNCTKFLVKILIRLFKKKVFFIINRKK